MAKETYKTYAEKLKDPRWQKRRLEIFERDEFTCQCCRDTENTLHVHHLQYFKGEPWDVEDIYLITLCENCHEYEEKLKSIDILGSAFSQYGLTRIHMIRLLEHCKYAIEKSNIKDRPRFEPLDEVFQKIVSQDEMWDYVHWLGNGGRIDG